VILSFHNFRGHVSRGPAIINAIIGSPLSRNTEISYPEIALQVKYKVLWLDVSVKYTSVMNLFQTFYNASDKKSRLIFAEHPDFPVMFAQITTHH
jgi:hypothetical protein